MDTEENTSIDTDSEEDVVIVVEGDEADTVEEGDTVVIVDSTSDDGGDSDAVDAVVIDNTIDNAVRIAELQAQIDALSNVAIDASITADHALNVAEENAEVTEEVIVASDENFEEIDEALDGEDDGGEEEPPDIEPIGTKVHPLFRSFGDWKSR